LIITVVKIALLLFIVLTVNAYLTWFERKVVAHIQSRWGPHRVGPHGLLQPLADGLKFLFKEDPTPAGVDKFVYYLAPLLSLALALTALLLFRSAPSRCASSVMIFISASPTSTSASSLFSPSPPSVSTASRSRAGPRTASIR
jgi:NADH-quinone oxidoreductase subunit H